MIEYNNRVPFSQICKGEKVSVRLTPNDTLRIRAVKTWRGLRVLSSEAQSTYLPMKALKQSVIHIEEPTRFGTAYRRIYQFIHDTAPIWGP